MVVVLEEKDEEKLQCLTYSTASYKMIDKSTYASWTRYFDEGQDSHDGVVLEALKSY